MSGLFNQPTSCLILMDLLYTHERYHQLLHVIDTFSENVKDSEATDEKYPHSCSILAVAACHKLVSSADDLTPQFSRTFLP